MVNGSTAASVVVRETAADSEPGDDAANEAIGGSLHLEEGASFTGSDVVDQNQAGEAEA